MAGLRLTPQSCHVGVVAALAGHRPSDGYDDMAILALRAPPVTGPAHPPTRQQERSHRQGDDRSDGQETLAAAAATRATHGGRHTGGGVVLSRIAGVVVPVFGRLRVTTDTGAAPPAVSIIIANHTSLSDPVIVLAALRRICVI